MKSDNNTKIWSKSCNLNSKYNINFILFQYTVIPTRRGTAEAIQILISHFAGDAGSPYLIGVISDSLKETRFSEANVCTASNSTELDAIELCENQRNFYSMQYAFMLNIVMVLLGAVCFIICAIYVVRDKERVERFVAGKKIIFFDFSNIYVNV